MNNDAYLIFEAYKNKKAALLSEAPVGFPDLFSKMSPEEQQQSVTGAKAEFPEGSKGKYAIDEQQTVQVIASVVDYLKKNDGYSPKLYKDFQADVVAPAVRQIVPTINTTNSKYTARVVYTAMRKAGIVKDETSGMEGVRKDRGYPSEKGKQQLAAKIVSDPEKFEEEEVAEEKPVAKAYNPNAEYYFKTIDEIPSGTLQGDLKIQYERLSNLTGETMRGSDFEKQFQRYNLPTNLVSKFARLDIMTTLSAEEGGDDEFKSEEDVIRDYTGIGARPTGKSVFGGGGNSFGVDFG